MRHNSLIRDMLAESLKEIYNITMYVIIEPPLDPSHHCRNTFHIFIALPQV